MSAFFISIRRITEKVLDAFLVKLGVLTDIVSQQKLSILCTFRCWD